MPSSALIIPPTPIIGIFPFKHLLRCLITFVDFIFNGAPDNPPSYIEYLDFKISFLSIVVLVAITPST